MLLYLNFRRLTETLIVMLSVPFALAGFAAETWAARRLHPVGWASDRHSNDPHRMRTPCTETMS
ncbi:MAG: hypothetical protein JNK52_03000 [Zoogloeaceae bacterium]|nr:hypothetical protein [Zoogloeaceae bacterium]